MNSSHHSQSQSHSIQNQNQNQQENLIENSQNSDDFIETDENLIDQDILINKINILMNQLEKEKLNQSPKDHQDQSDQTSHPIKDSNQSNQNNPIDLLKLDFNSNFTDLSSSIHLNQNKPSPSLHKNRSSPLIRQMLNKPIKPPSLPTNDDLELDKLKLIDQSFTPNQSQHQNPSQPSSPNQITNSDSINPPSNPSSSDSSSNSNSNSQKSSPKSSKLQSLPNLDSNQSNLDLNQLNINKTPIESQPPSNDDSSIGVAFQPNYQIHPSQSLNSSSSSNVLNQSSSSSINSKSHGNLQPQFQSINLLNQSHPAISSSINSNLIHPPHLNSNPIINLSSSNQIPSRPFYHPHPFNQNISTHHGIPSTTQQQPFGLNYTPGNPGYSDPSYLLNQNPPLSHPQPRLQVNSNPNLIQPPFTQQHLQTPLSSQTFLQTPLSRSPTTLSSSSQSIMKSSLNSLSRPTSNTSKSNPSISKASIDDYRNRIKSDPDPEAHFNFAKFLIEAAKTLASGGAAGDDKAIKKYRDALLQESLKLIKKLATQGVGVGKPAYSDAQFFLANCLGNGSLGLQVDHEKAYNLYVQASKQNHPEATYRTAVCNELGAGTRKDAHRAMLFYRKAAALGDTAGMYKLAMILLNGLLGQPKNPNEALLWLKRAAQQADEDNPHALHELAQIYEKPPLVNLSSNPNPSAKNSSQPNYSYLVQRDEPYSRELYTQAAHLGYPPSQNRLGACYEYGSLTCPIDPRRSIAWYTKAAERGDAESELALSGWYLTGLDGVLKQSDSEAYLWARRSASKGLPKAEYAVGYYSEVGIGVKQDIEEAKRWYMRAATNKNKRAMQRLTELKKLGSQKPGHNHHNNKKQARPTRDEAASECLIT
ncbi:hypothetical protein O181_049785 [Austropuccinia psidii MF-1]|uniref:HCP-like protein n=1 Tax=Austropuccinia psidii MF-1 TaxID=1389203 RepID=A0A9Q3HQD2_9BASI|nr:hypothetical protein [Austropuccinia psidii MF-1]